MKNSLKKIIDKFLTKASNWECEKMTGALALELDFNQGGVTDWKIKTEGKDEEKCNAKAQKRGNSSRIC